MDWKSSKSVPPMSVETITRWRGDSAAKTAASIARNRTK